MPRAWLGRLAEPLSSNVLWPKRTWILLLHCSCCLSARTSLKGQTRYSSNYRMNEHDLVNKVCNYSEFPQVAGSDRSQMPGRKTLRQPPSLQSLGHCSNASKNMNLDINQRHQATTSSNQNPLEVRLPPALESRMFGSAPAQPSTFAAQSPMLLNLLCCFMLAILTHWKIKPISRMVVDVFPMSFHIFSIKFQAFNYPQCPSHISGSNSSRARHERWTWGTGEMEIYGKIIGLALQDNYHE